MNKSKEKNQNSLPKQKKKLREINSYKFQFKTKIKQKSNINSKEKDKSKNKKNQFSQSNISVKTFNQKPTSSIIKEYNSQNINNNNAISYSNYAFSEMEQTKKIDNNIFIDSSKYNSEEYNTLLSSNNKMDINDLSNTNNKKISMRIDKNNYNYNIERDIDFQKNNFSKRAAYSMLNENEKKFDNSSYNISSNLKKYNYKTSLERLENKLNSELDIKSFKKKSLENMEKDLKNKNELEQYINVNSKININKVDINNNNIYEQNSNNIEVNNNKKKQNKKGKGKKILNNNVQINNNNIQATNRIEEQNNFNGQEMDQNNNNNIYEQDLNNLEQINNFNGESNLELYTELEEKLQNLYFKIHRNLDEPQSEIVKSLYDDSLKYGNQWTYPTLKRYRQKSEPNLRTTKYEQDINSYNNRNNNLNINYNTIRKRSENKINNIKSTPNQLIIKKIYNENDNKNLSKFKMLIDDLKTENTTKRMIDILLNQQNNPELKNILSKLQMTIKNLPNNENSKDDINISTLPANHLFPFNIIKFEKNNIIKNNYKFDICKDINEINHNRKIEKLKNKFNDFQDIMNKKPKNNNNINIKTKTIGINNLNYNKNPNMDVYSNLCPPNNLENGLFFIEK